MNITYDPAKAERKWLTDGLTDVLCDVVPLMNDKRAAKPLARRLNVEKAGSRALAFCGTNYPRPVKQNSQEALQKELSGYAEELREEVANLKSLLC